MMTCIYLLQLLVFFFFKQKTAYEMRISDWSSDVCSSDLSKHEAASATAASSPTRNICCRSGRSASISATRAISAGATINKRARLKRNGCARNGPLYASLIATSIAPSRSDERRVGKECVSTCRSRWQPYHYKKNTSKN